MDSKKITELEAKIAKLEADKKRLRNGYELFCQFIESGSRLDKAVERLLKETE